MDFDIYGLRIFCQVMTDKTFSAAARTLKITQPTVSQQIGKLETLLGGKLFERIGHDIVPTPLAARFYEFSCQIMDQINEFESGLQKDRQELQGTVRYGMPESCQWTPHYKRIMGEIRTLPHLRFQIDILTNDGIIQALLEARLDFGFVVGERVTPELRFQKFSEECYSAVAVDARLLAALHNDDSNEVKEPLRLITYPGWELFFTTWAKGMGLKTKMQKMEEPTVRVGTLAGAIHAAQNGAGVAVIPTHCVQSDLDSGTLHEWTGQKRGHRPFQPVYLARKIGTRLPKRAETVMQMLLAAKTGAG